MLVEIQESLYPTAKISCGHDCMQDLMHCECNQGIRCYKNPDNTRNHMYKMCDWNSIRRIYVQTDTPTQEVKVM